ncbi:MAG TPA: alpha/beta hydrolase [Gemmatales bacterium]|nr:alpha/beta hydrolase [Gemmatales bacterium]HMP60851.1 alpha/beta hydrolase [Gemmatales bacterium]
MRKLWVHVCFILLLAGCMGRSFEESLVFLPLPFPEYQRLPEDATFEDAWFDAPGGPRLHGWYVEGARPGPVVLYCHGNAGNISHRRWLLHLYRERLNATVLVFDYRGYGKSVGTPSEPGVLADARAARRWLAQRAGVDEGEIILVGNSLGGGVAVDLAATDGARGLVLENTFTSLPDVVACYAKLLPDYPIHWLMWCRLDSEAKIRSYHGPLLMTHGTADPVVPYRLGHRLYEAANEPKRLVTVPGGGHFERPSGEYLQALEGFLAAHPAREGGQSRLEKTVSHRLKVIHHHRHVGVDQVLGDEGFDGRPGAAGEAAADARHVDGSGQLPGLNGDLR